MQNIIDSINIHFWLHLLERSSPPLIELDSKFLILNDRIIDVDLFDLIC